MKFPTLKSHTNISLIHFYYLFFWFILISPHFWPSYYRFISDFFSCLLVLDLSIRTLLSSVALFISLFSFYFSCPLLDHIFLVPVVAMWPYVKNDTRLTIVSRNPVLRAISSQSISLIHFLSQIWLHSGLDFATYIIPSSTDER